MWVWIVLWPRTNHLWIGESSLIVIGLLTETCQQTYFENKNDFSALVFFLFGKKFILATHINIFSFLSPIKMKNVEMNKCLLKSSSQHLWFNRHIGNLVHGEFEFTISFLIREYSKQQEVDYGNIITESHVRCQQSEIKNNYITRLLKNVWNVQMCVISIKTVSRTCKVAKWDTVFAKMCEKNVQMCVISIKNESHLATLHVLDRVFAKMCEQNVQMCVISIKTVSRTCKVAKWDTVFAKMCEKNVQMCVIFVKKWVPLGNLACS